MSGNLITSQSVMIVVHTPGKKERKKTTKFVVCLNSSLSKQQVAYVVHAAFSQNTSLDFMAIILPALQC